jgi:thiamine-monophosphate kinase
VNAKGGEDRLIDWLARRIRRQPRQQDGPRIGDDAAVLPPGAFAVTVDHQIEGIHFPTGLDPAVVARRLLAVNLSDLAASGAVPRYAFLALAAPPGFDHRRFFVAMLAFSRKFGVELAGGDLARNPDRFSASLTLMGTQAGGRWIERSGARAGHALWLGGTIGESCAGRLLIERGGWKEGDPLSLRAAAKRAMRRHLEPQPQLALGRWLSDQEQGAGMDVSDGLARDLHRLCKASGVGAEIDAALLPFSSRFQDLCKLIAADPLELALGGGEDYVLLFTLPEGIEPPEGHRIGTISKARKLTIVRDGKRSALPDVGWDHL